jgi:hypothetical protein
LRKYLDEMGPIWSHFCHNLWHRGGRIMWWWWWWWSWGILFVGAAIARELSCLFSSFVLQLQHRCSKSCRSWKHYAPVLWVP